MLQDIRMRRNIDMKKKIIILLSIIVAAFLVTNIVTYAYSKENMFEFFFADNNAVQKRVTNNLLTRENQKIEIDNYVIKLEYKGNKLYIYIYFEINNEISKDTDLNKCIKITDNGEKINNEYKQYNFNLKFVDDCKEFKSKDGVLYLSPLGLRYVTNNTMDELVITIKDENDKTVNSLSNSDNMLSESGKRYKDITKVQYAAEFDELLDLKKVYNIYINENKLEEVK